MTSIIIMSLRNPPYEIFVTSLNVFTENSFYFVLNILAAWVNFSESGEN